MNHHLNIDVNIEKDEIAKNTFEGKYYTTKGVKIIFHPFFVRYSFFK